MHHHRDIGKAWIILDQAGQYIAVHFRHFGIHQNRLEGVVQTLALVPLTVGEGLQAIPNFTAIVGLMILTPILSSTPVISLRATTESSQKKMN